MMRIVIATIAMAAMSACTKKPAESASTPTDSPAEVGDITTAPVDTANSTPLATAEISSLSGSAVGGNVEFRLLGSDLEVIARVTGVTPPGLHGIHIHEFGDCSAPDGSTAGGHFNPTSTQHAGPNSRSGHIGDLGNIEVGDDGAGTHRIVLETAYYDEESVGGWQAIVGKSVIVHSGPDDLTSQPSGDAGGRIGCGLIVTATSAPSH